MVSFEAEDSHLFHCAISAVRMVSGLINANPTVYEKKDRRVRTTPCDPDEYAVEPIDQEEVFDILSLLLHLMVLRVFLVVPSFIFLLLIKRKIFFVLSFFWFSFQKDKIYI